MKLLVQVAFFEDQKESYETQTHTDGLTHTLSMAQVINCDRTSRQIIQAVSLKDLDLIQQIKEYLAARTGELNSGS